MDDTASSETSFKCSDRDFVSLLIELYRKKPILWKCRHELYLNKQARATALEEIARELQVYKPEFTAEDVKKKVNIIRTNFNKEKHRIEKWRAQGNPNPKPGLWYFNELLFLDESGLPPVRRNSIASTSDVQESAENSDSEEQKYLPEVGERKLQVATQELLQKAKQRTLRSPQKVQKYKNITIKRRRVEPEPQPEEEREEEEEEDKEEPEQYMTVTTTYYKKPKKREDVLAEMWAMKLKKMSPDQKVFAEKIINDVLYEGELGNLSKNGVTFCPNF